jgi:hypothetical protein
MSWFVYSPENFPKRDEDNNEWVDYRGACGMVIILRAHEWTPLEDFYKSTRWESWLDMNGDGRESVVSGKQVAERLVGDFRLRGIRSANLDKLTAEEKTAIEKEAEEANMKFRRMFILRFEQQFRVKMQGGPGRWVPNTYEQECYDLHKLRPPDVVQHNQPAAPVPERIIVQPDPEMIQQLVAQQVAAEIAKITEPAPKHK